MSPSYYPTSPIYARGTPFYNPPSPSYADDAEIPVAKRVCWRDEVDTRVMAIADCLWVEALSVTVTVSGETVTVRFLATDFEALAQATDGRFADAQWPSVERRWSDRRITLEHFHQASHQAAFVKFVVGAGARCCKTLDAWRSFLHRVAEHLDSMAAATDVLLMLVRELEPAAALAVLAWQFEDDGAFRVSRAEGGHSRAWSDVYCLINQVAIAERKPMLERLLPGATALGCDQSSLAALQALAEAKGRDPAEAIQYVGHDILTWLNATVGEPATYGED